MKSFIVPMSLVLAVSMGVSVAYAQTSTESTVPSRARTAEVSVTGQITAIDPQQRMITVVGPRGRSATFAVDDKVRNFNEMQVGDTVTVDYLVAVLITLRKDGDGIRERVESETAAMAPAGARPGVVATGHTTIVANVENVDQKTSSVTLKGPGGRVVDMTVKDPKVLQEVRVGDQVVASFYEATAVGVRAAAPQKP